MDDPLAAMPAGKREVLAAATESLGRVPNVVAIVLGGSCARGVAGEASDNSTAGAWVNGGAWIQTPVRNWTSSIGTSTSFGESSTRGCGACGGTTTINSRRTEVPKHRLLRGDAPLPASARSEWGDPRVEADGCHISCRTEGADHPRRLDECRVQPVAVRRLRGFRGHVTRLGV